MSKNKMKVAALLVLCGSVFQFGGCFGGLFNRTLQALPAGIIADFVTDNDGVFDLFQD